MKRLFFCKILTLVWFFGSNYVTAQPSNTLYYPLDKVYTTFVPDESGNGNHGYALDVLGTTDRHGIMDGALYFNGYNSHILFDGNQFQYDAYSYTLWVKMMEYPDPDQAGFILDIGSAYGIDQYITAVNSYSNYDLDGILGQGYNTDGSTTFLCNEELLSLYEWYFIVYTRDTEHSRLYINTIGVDKQLVNEKYPLYGNSLTGRVGCRNNNQQFFKGCVDDVRIFNYVIGHAEIDSLYGIVTELQDKIPSLGRSFIYPNPANHVINLRLEEDYVSNTKLSVYSCEGKKVIDCQGQSQIQISELPNGFYYLQIENYNTGSVNHDKFLVIR